MKAAVLALAALLGGCAGAPKVADLRPVPGAHELDATPFFPQDEFQCGPAALATVLAASGIDASPDELAPKVYLPGRRGSLQPEIIATSRGYGRVPFPLSTDLRDLLAEVAAGHPVLVLQNLGLSFWPAWHYAVVVGYDAGDNTLVLRSGRERRKRMSLGAFTRSWSLAGRWGLVLATPDAPPSTATARRWLLAASAFEELGQPQVAATAYQAAVARWPNEALAWQLLGNARYALADRPGAEQAFRAALVIEPAVATRNNLALVLLERGCPAAAAAQVELAREGEATAAERAALERTHATIRAYAGPRAPDCP